MKGHFGAVKFYWGNVKKGLLGIKEHPSGLRLHSEQLR